MVMRYAICGITILLLLCGCVVEPMSRESSQKEEYAEQACKQECIDNLPEEQWFGGAEIINGECYCNYDEAGEVVIAQSLELVSQCMEICQDPPEYFSSWGEVHSYSPSKDGKNCLCNFENKEEPLIVPFQK